MVKKLMRSKLFWLGLIARVLFLGFAGSHYLTDLFVPFLDRAVLHPGVNPWTLSPPEFFPYGSVLFLLLYLPRWLVYSLIGPAALDTGFLGIALIKLPLLILDLVLLTTLIRTVRQQSRQILIYYWLNPILFYITYIHGQLDIAAMALCILSLLTLVEEKWAASAATMAMALLCKFHVLILVPFMMVYIWNRYFLRDSFRRIGLWLSLFTLVSLIGFLPVILAGRLSYNSMSSPEAMRLFAAHITFSANETLYVGLFLLMAWLGRLCLSTRISTIGLVLGSGSLLGVLLLVTNPMPGWYFWFVPFLSLLYAYYVNVPRSLYVLLVAAYFLNFVICPALPQAHVISAMGLTILQVSLFAMLVAVERIVLSGEASLQRRAKAIRIGIAGDSGAGKSHLSRCLTDVFNPQNALIVAGDDYHRWERASANWQHFTHLNPRANNLTQLADHAQKLGHGLRIYQPEYDHREGRFTSARELSAGKIIIFQGLHSLYLRQLQMDLDLKIFMQPEEKVRFAWKLKRDVLERGHTIDQVKRALENRSYDAIQHIFPQKRSADWIIEFLSDDLLEAEQILKGADPSVFIRHTLWNDAPVTDIVELLNQSGCQIQQKSLPEDERVSYTIRGQPTSQDIADIAAQIFPSLRHISRGRYPPKWKSGNDGILQLFTLALLDYKLKAKAEA